MNEEEKLQALLRLKRHEAPPDGYFDQFLKDFQERQRKEILQRGSISLFWERIQTWMDGLRRPAVAWSLAGAYAIAMALILAWPRPTRTTSSMLIVTGGAGGGGSMSHPVSMPVPPREKRLIPASDGSRERPAVIKERTMTPNGAGSVIGPAEEVPKPPENQKPPPGNLREL